MEKKMKITAQGVSFDVPEQWKENVYFEYTIHSPDPNSDFEILIKPIKEIEGTPEEIIESYLGTMEGAAEGFNVIKKEAISVGGENGYRAITTFPNENQDKTIRSEVIAVVTKSNKGFYIMMNSSESEFSKYGQVWNEILGSLSFVL